MEGTILFSVVGRTQYGFDIYSVDVSASVSDHQRDFCSFTENRLTDGVSVNFNGSFSCFPDNIDDENASAEKLVYVSERTGLPKIYINSQNTSHEMGPLQFQPVGEGHGEEPSGFFFDRPFMRGDRVFFIATQKGFTQTRECYTALYVTSVSTGETMRLTPPNVADFSPSLSPSGDWVAVASYEGRGWQGEIHDLHTNIYVFNAKDGSGRRLVAQNGGWPTWADDGTLYFHRKSDDGWWSIYKLSDWANAAESMADAERVTPPCVHAFTPAAMSPLAGNWIAVATRRMNSKWRHIEIFDLDSKEFIQVTEKLHPEQHHYNPFIAPRSRRLGYHRCRVIDGPCSDVDDDSRASTQPIARIPRLEAIECPTDRLSLIRVDGFFPTLSPCGRFIAYNRGLPGSSSFGLYVMRSDGSKSWLVAEENIFSAEWDPQRKGVMYGTLGSIFAPPSMSVQVAALHIPLNELTDDVDRVSSGLKILTKPDTGNNGFPAPSPDGKWLVFRSGRAGGKGKNLYIMDAELAEDAEVRRLTCGEWTDTMPCWSPDGQWITFSSTRHGADEGCFGLYMIRPDGSGLHRVQPSPQGSKTSDDDEDCMQNPVLGRINHPKFSPDGKSITFTADLSGISAEPISLPNQFQPYGEIFISRVDGSELIRLTHNAYEDGLPSWTPFSIKLPHQQQSMDPSFITSSFSEPLQGYFIEPLFLNRVTEEMKVACCVAVP
ncbi:hypothetical protein KP509_30G043300 [Ceratopteris richardii]|uniref:Uncharacterized protein n=1 Tax=Ceratopteris richardii TaxID=49495 RepID=A0A8T2R1W7_CERRI|nr:hypothetical protein KP509_30G043300 [Ceratopteris richardii]